MGSLLRGETFPVEKRQMFFNVFSKIPQKVLWKWEGDELPGKPSNVMTRKWMPQRDILGIHTNYTSPFNLIYVILIIEVLRLVFKIFFWCLNFFFSFSYVLL